MKIEILLSLLLLLTLLRIAISSRLEVYLKMLSFQGLLLCCLSLMIVEHGSTFTMIVAIIETLLLKAIFVPYYLKKVIIQHHVKREAEPYLPNLFSLLIVIGCIIIGMIGAYHLQMAIKEIKMLIFGVGITLILCGMFIILSRKKLITHVMGFCIMENGIFLLTLGIAHELPLMVSLGVALDAFIWVLLSGILVKLIRIEFKDNSIEQLKDLRY
ncbi:MAG: hypothetical protein IKD09_07120 [Lentisphaeria bacterium]|nr:hypothetical protein [Lentisphaeria bacterium]